MTKLNPGVSNAVAENRTVVESATTQRAYTLRLRGTDANDNSWREALWSTHEAVNNGAKTFGDWLLTLRGGMCHTLARSDQGRRTLLALSWLSVESAPKKGDRYEKFVVACGEKDSQSSRNEKVLKRLREILVKRGVSGTELDSWVSDCAPSLSSAIRDDAVWIDRSEAFDQTVVQIGGSLTRDVAWDFLDPFFGNPDTYLSSLSIEDDDESESKGKEEKAKDLGQKAGQWLSSRFGTGKGANFESFARVYDEIANWSRSQIALGKSVNIKSLVDALISYKPVSNDAGGLLKLISGPGYKSGTQNVIKEINKDGNVPIDLLKKLSEAATKDVLKSRTKTSGKGRRPYSDVLMSEVEAACGFTYLLSGGPSRHSEFAVMLDHAARRVSIAHTWIKRAEAERQNFKADAHKMSDVPAAAKIWLDNFCKERTLATNALEPYRIRKRALGGWKEVVTRWNRADCETVQNRIDAAREIQDDPDIEKFGDIQLFEAIAADEALCVWKPDGNASTQPLIDYSAASDAVAKQQRFKVPAYRHPDSLLHPIFCDFGNSRWEIKFAVHEAATKLEAARKRLVKKEADFIAATDRLVKAKTPERTAIVQVELEEIGKEITQASDDVKWLSTPHGITLGLWNGVTVHRVPKMSWSSKRLAKDLALGQMGARGSLVDATRADRLGRAAASATQDDVISVLNVFDQANWNGRLQAPRAQFAAIAKHVSKQGWDSKARQMRDRIRWLVTFSAALQPTGPWIDYVPLFNDQSAAKPFVTRKGEFAIKHADNDKRGTKLILSRLPGLRILSVDLGHRYAAACAVWEAISSEQMVNESKKLNHRAPTSTDLYLHLKCNADPKKSRTTIYRRIGADTIKDSATGKVTPHPAPWARLERQFLIKLPGEQQQPRAASSKDAHGVNELQLVETLAKQIGQVVEDDANKKDRSVHELMARAVRLVALGLKRHARRAKIAYAFDPATTVILGMGASEKEFTEGDSAHIGLFADALIEWHSLATDAKWNDKRARNLWNQHVSTIAGGWTIEDPKATDEVRTTSKQRTQSEDSLRLKMAPIAQQLVKINRSAIHNAWKDRWESDNGRAAKIDKATGQKTFDGTGFHASLRWVTDWIMGKNLIGATGDGWKQNVGGLSVTRITTMKALYQLHKAFAMRATPLKPRGAPEKGESNIGIAQSILIAMERMRDQRVKQIASRIAGSALGLGGQWVMRDIPANENKKRSARTKLVWLEDLSPKYSPCHAVVIENLKNYRPDEMRTRRENSQLLSWASSKVEKYLGEACQLNGLHLRSVSAGYTSRQDSRTGAPGIRCCDVSVKDFQQKPWWRKSVEAAKQKNKEGKGSAFDRYLETLDEQHPKSTSTPSGVQLIRIPVSGGDLFVSADHSSPAAKGLQADLNAAANIGLKALLDPDWQGKWWFVPCASVTNTPVTDKVKGSQVISNVALIPIVQGGTKPARSKVGKKERDVVNIWRDPSSLPIKADGNWFGSIEYWNKVRIRVIDVIQTKNNFAKLTSTQDTPW
jgi:hypothetical protein